MPTDKGMIFIPKVCSPKCLRYFLKNHFVGITLFNKNKQEHIIPIAKWKNMNEFINKFRSDYEQVFSDWVIRSGMSCLYEPIIFDSNYVPDFLIGYAETMVGLFIEVKGTWEAGALPKIQRFAKYLKEYNVPIFVINTHLINLIKKEKNEKHI